VKTQAAAGGKSICYTAKSPKLDMWGKTKVRTTWLDILSIPQKKAALQGQL
jgi:hypothetical protein